MPLSTQARRHRNDLAELARLAESDMSVLFRDITDAIRVREALADTLPKLAGLYGSAAASLGADWYDDLRERAGAKGRFRAIAAELPNKSRTDSLARWSIAPLFGADPDGVTALSKAAGGLQRVIFNADRETVRFSSIQDRGAEGWVRVGYGECDWCRQYLDGEIRSSEGYGFDAHDNCKCTAEPAFY